MNSNGFNFDALHKAYETGILNKEDFGTDEEWTVAMDIFSEQMSEELEIPDLNNPSDELTDFSDIIPGYGQDFNPYDDFQTIDDTDYPLAHGQLLPHLAGKVSPDLIFQLGQGNFDALENIEDETTRNWAYRRIEELDNAGAWNKNWNQVDDKSNDFDPFADTWGDGTY